MARPRRTTSPPRTLDRQPTSPQRNISMRNNARRVGANQPFQGGIGQGLTVPQGERPGQTQGPMQRPPQGPMQRPSLGTQQCPPGQESGIDPNTGAQMCKPIVGGYGDYRTRANVTGNIPINNPQSPTQGLGRQNERPTKGPGRQRRPGSKY